MIQVNSGMRSSWWPKPTFQNAIQDSTHGDHQERGGDDLGGAGARGRRLGRRVVIVVLGARRARG